MKKLKKDEIKLIKKLNVLDNPISIYLSVGGEVEVPISYDYLEDFIENWWEKDVTLKEKVEFDTEFNEVKNIYSCKNYIGYTKCIKENLIFKGWIFNNEYESLTIDEYIDYLYKYRNFNKIMSKNNFKISLGEEIFEQAKTNISSFENNENENHKTNSVKGIVYLLKIKDKKQYKIGVTTDLDRRLSQITPKMPFELEVVNTIKSHSIYKLEQQLHYKYKEKNINGEWFGLEKEDVNYIKNIKSSWC